PSNVPPRRISNGRSSFRILRAEVEDIVSVFGGLIGGCTANWPTGQWRVGQRVLPAQNSVDCREFASYSRDPRVYSTERDVLRGRTRGTDQGDRPWVCPGQLAIWPTGHLAGERRAEL